MKIAKEKTFEREDSKWFGQYMNELKEHKARGLFDNLFNKEIELILLLVGSAALIKAVKK